MDRPPGLYIDYLQRTRPWFAGLAIVFAQYGLYTNIGGLTFTLAPMNGGAATSPATALCVSMMGASLINQYFHGPRYVSICLVILALLVASFSAFPADLKSAAFLRSGVSGTMGSDTFMIIACLCSAALVRRRFFRTGAALCITSLLMLFNSLVGRSFGLPYFSGDMAPATMVALSCISLAAITIFIEFGQTRVLFLNTDIGDVTRRSVLFGASLPWLGGIYLHHYTGVAERAYPVEAIIFTLFIFANTLNAIRSGNALARADEKRRSAEELLETMAITDPLTHLLNRNGADRHLQLKRTTLSGSGDVSAIVLMDIDHFKTVNDRFGHDVGDMVLSHVKPTLEPYLRESDMLARWGGEEFLVYLAVSGPEDLPPIVERLRFAVQNIHYRLKEAGVENAPNISASFGVSSIQDGEAGFEEAIRRADVALYQAKDEGRNKAVFDPRLGLTETHRKDRIALVSGDRANA